MSKADKKIEKWLNNTPTEDRIEAVEAALERHLPGQYEKKSGSHIIVKHEILKGLDEFGPLGELSIPVKSGQKVKGVYLKKLAVLLTLIKEMDSK